jgi:hypothetical protein
VYNEFIIENELSFGSLNMYSKPTLHEKVLSMFDPRVRVMKVNLGREWRGEKANTSDEVYPSEEKEISGKGMGEDSLCSNEEDK